MILMVRYSRFSTK
uniref:Uncharacterized protein n=1 Tax=Anguilla anguilla TaxID=7936 RepID=A0A0E9V4Y7_ANGAN